MDPEEADLILVLNKYFGCPLEIARLIISWKKVGEDMDRRDHLAQHKKAFVFTLDQFYWNHRGPVYNHCWHCHAPVDEVFFKGFSNTTDSYSQRQSNALKYQVAFFIGHNSCTHVATHYMGYKSVIKLERNRPWPTLIMHHYCSEDCETESLKHEIVSSPIHTYLRVDLRRLKKKCHTT